MPTAGSELADADEVRLRRAARVAFETGLIEVEAFVTGGDDEEGPGRRRQRPAHASRPSGNRLADVDYAHPGGGGAADRPCHQQRLAEAGSVDVREGDEADRNPTRRGAFAEDGRNLAAVTGRIRRAETGVDEADPDR